jgi:endonuclease-3
LLVPFGKNICTPIGPKCSICPLLDMCAQRGVTSSR